MMEVYGKEGEEKMPKPQKHLLLVFHTVEEGRGEREDLSIAVWSLGIC